MGVACGSQIVLCEYPIRFDTYTGCSHGCKYCFARAKVDIDKIKSKNAASNLLKFINGERSSETCWCDWNIPLHWGGLSDPFQPCEREAKASLDCLKIFAETQYPVIISTKGSLVCEEPYISLLRKCNAVVQVSMVCPSYDVMEPGAPTYEERLDMVEKLSVNCRRVIARVQPYITDIRDEFIALLPELKRRGVYGVTVEGMKFKKRKPGLVNVGNDWCYPERVLKSDYEMIRDAAHAVGLAFYCAENRLRPMGDSFACCGCGDIEGFAGNSYNAVSMINGIEVVPTERMKQENTGAVFHAMNQQPGTSAQDRRTPFDVHMKRHAVRVAKMLG